MIKSFSFLVLLPVLASSARATELTDLGQGLGYLRIHSAADSEQALRSAVPGAGALVLDLRYATGDEASADALRAGLAAHTAPNAPVFILVGPATPAAFATALARSASSVFTLGIAGSQPAPKVIVKTDAASDRRAYDALESGTPVGTIISGKVDKERFDEATLMEEFKNGNPDTDLPGDRPGQTPAGQQTGTVSPDAPDPAETKTAGAEAKPTPPVDRVLQRAVHLHRAMLALKPRA